MKECMISKELLSEVLGLKVWKVLDCNMNTLRYCIYPNEGDEPSEYMFPINIYELAFKCKEWAYENKTLCGYNIELKSYKSENDYWLCELMSEDITFSADTEPEAIFEACQWILENKETK